CARVCPVARRSACRPDGGDRALAQAQGARRVHHSPSPRTRARIPIEPVRLAEERGTDQLRKPSHSRSDPQPNGIKNAQPRRCETSKTDTTFGASSTDFGTLSDRCPTNVRL